ncbi:MAG: hypothetical protein GXP59_09635, partial [Deltaproteobacteria bacterium]|nr:hypothetical protein [Deltaproteobacteria bacterium]
TPVAADLYIGTIGGRSAVTSSVTGNPWTWRLATWADSTDGALSSTISSSQTLQQLFQEEWPGYIRMGAITATWDPATGNITDGHTAAGWVNITDAVAGLSFGDLQGTFDNTTLTWQTVGQGVSMDVNTYLYLVQNNKTALQALNIPSFEVGSADLTGANTKGLTVNMNNVVFYTSTATGTPQVWATNDINGSYTTTPVASESVSLAATSGGNNLTANFVVHNWTAGGNWAATVESGSGTLATATSYQNVGGNNTISNLQFGGVAAGTDNGNNNFIGTGAGYAH